LKKD
jgi:hypothetical protein